VRIDYKRTCYIFLAFAMSLFWGCDIRTTKDDVLNDYLRLNLSVVKKPEVEKQFMFKLTFSTSGPKLWPSRESNLEFYIDDKKVDIPSQASWTWHVKYDHILADAPRSAYWHMTEDELQEWLGKGVHEIYFRFSDVESNRVRICIHNEGIHIGCESGCYQPN